MKFPCLRILLFAVIALLTGIPALHALSPDFYAASSRLASGYWVKVSVTQSGMYCLTDQQLRQWGFSDPSRVKVYGYGARRLPERLDNSYIDDLPQTASEYIAGRGVVFYGEGPLSVTNTTSTAHRPVQNPFTVKGYYFLTADGSDERLVPAESTLSDPSAGSPARSVRFMVSHEQELESPGQAGHLLVGESFKFNKSQTFTLATPGADPDNTAARMEVSFIANTYSVPSQLTYTFNGTALPSSGGDRISVNSDHYAHGYEGVSNKSVTVDGPTATVGIDYACSGTVVKANLNYIAITYNRLLDVGNGGQMLFYGSSGNNGYSMAGGADGLRVWDVTSLTDISAMKLSQPDADGRRTWSLRRSGARLFAAWTPASQFMQATNEGVVRNQDLHAMASADMVIFTLPQWRTQANRLADFHRTFPGDTLTVAVLTPQEIYNEFSSGAPDAQAFRKLLKMLYDRRSVSEHPLRYALFMSRVTYDNRRLTPEVKSLDYPMLPAWFTDRGLHDNDSYTTDDIFSFLQDNSGTNTASDKLDIAVGRIPCTSASEAEAAVDKIERYTRKLDDGNWRNNFLITADDEDEAEHMIQAEKLWDFLSVADDGHTDLSKKIYIDEFPRVSNSTEDGRRLLFRALDEGALWWIYIGHANTTSLTAENFVNYTDLNNLYLRRFPVMYAATCNFLRWDSPTISGAEILFRNPNGGVAAVISAVRPVYIPNNGYLSAAFGRFFLARETDGRLLTFGEIYRRAKNDYRIYTKTDPLGRPAADSNKLRFVLMGDPAMRLAIPSNRVVIDKVAGKEVPVTPAKDAPCLMARQQTTMEGRVLNAAGDAVMTDFNGTVVATLYDAAQSVTTLGNGSAGVPFSFDKPQGDRLFIGNAKVTGGRFTLPVVMPSEVADNYRSAAINLYAYEEGTSSDLARKAVGVNRDFFVYGIDENARPDTVPPVIESFYLNHPSFRSGDTVNPNPTVIAEFSDDLSINLSSAGIGHSIALYLDNGEKSFADVADYFTPFVDGRNGGSIVYPIENLSDGPHSLRLRVWDTAPNSAEQTIDFWVTHKIAPQIYRVYTDCNPASEYANFYVSHDRPDAEVTVTVEVFDLMGRRLWGATKTGRSDMFESLPIKWDLTDYGGHRVGRGIYLYRATISDKVSGERCTTESQKLAVTAQ